MSDHTGSRSEQPADASVLRDKDTAILHNEETAILRDEVTAILRDEVDGLVEAWQRERPDLDVTPMAVLSRVTRLAHYLDRQRRTAFSRHDLESWEFDVLAALRRAGEPYQLSPGQLLRETMVTSGTMTNRVDRLTTRGLVTRTDHPDDRRGVLVRLTSSGKQSVDAAIADLMQAEQQILAVLPAAQRSQLAEALRRLIAPYDSNG